MRQHVKCSGFWGRCPGRRATVLAAVVLLGAPSTEAQRKGGGSVLLGGGGPSQKAPVALDPWLPTGAALFSGPWRPADAPEPPACSWKRPVCVHGGDTVASDAILAALSALENAYEALILTLGLPAPISDWGRGGSDALDLYLGDEPTAPVQIGMDSPEPTSVDQASGFCIAGPNSGMSWDRIATLCVAEASALRLDASATPHARRGFAAHLWHIVGRPESADWRAIDDSQSHPELAVGRRDLTSSSEGAGLLFDFLEERLSAASPGMLATSLIALGASKTGPDAARWDNEPDVFDVLRQSLEEKPRRMADLLGDFTVARAFAGNRDDGTHLPTLGWAGSFARARFDWAIPVSSLPRRVASLHPIEPTGAMYVWLRLDRPSDDLTLGFQAEWEAPVAFSWVLVRIDAQGRELSRVYAPVPQRGTQTDQRLVDFRGTAAVLVAGTNVGGVDPTHPFDPDVAPFEGHGCTVYLTPL